MAGRARFRVIAAEEGMMLRQLLCRRFHGMGADEAADLIKAGGVYVGNTRIRLPMVRVAPGERITVYREARATREIAPDALRIVHRAADLVIVDKPAGVPATSSLQSARGTVAQALVHRLLRAEAAVLRPYVGPIRPIPTGASGLVAFTVRGQDEVSALAEFLAAEAVAVDRLRVRGRAPDLDRWEGAVILGRSGRLRPSPADARGAVVARSELRCLARDGEGDGETSLCEIVSTNAPGALALVHVAQLGLEVVREADEGDGGEDDGGEGDADEPAAPGLATASEAPATPTMDPGLATPPSPGAPPGDPGAAGDDDAPMLFVRARVRLMHPRTGEVIEAAAELPAWARA